MPINLVEKYSEPEVGLKPLIKIKRVLTDAEEKNLLDFFVYQKPFSKNNEYNLLMLCNTIYDHNWWLQCQCIEDHQKPIMRFKRSSSGRLYLHHINSRGAHHKTCSFEKEFSIPDDKTKTSPVFFYLKPTGALNIMKKRAHGLTNTSKDIKKEGVSLRGQNLPTLCKVLYRLLDDAKCHIISPDSSIHPFKALQDTISKTQLLANFPLKDYFYFDAKSIVKASIALREDKREWPKDISRHALFLLNVTDIQDNTLITTSLDGSMIPVTLSNKIIKLSGRLGERSKPYMALMRLTDSPQRPKFYTPFDAFVVPRYSDKSLIPVDSFYEREMLRALFKLQFELKKKNVLLTIEKPLFPIEVTQNNESFGVLPDFIVKTSFKTFIIEVNGSHEEDYKIQKYRTQEKMRLFSEILIFDALQSEKEARLTTALNEFILTLKGLLC